MFYEIKTSDGSKILSIENKFIYEISITRSGRDELGIFRYETIDSGYLISEEFKGFEIIENIFEATDKKKKIGINYCKILELVAAPEQFINQNNGIQYEYISKKQRKKGTNNKS